MYKIKLNTKNSISNIYIGEIFVNDILTCLDFEPQKVLFLTDDNIADIYSDYINKLQAVFLENNIKFYLHLIPQGEQSKTLSTHNEIVNVLAANSFTRSDCVFSFGGGVISDIAGFVACTYMRGMKLVSMPSTLLAMVDAAIGGKCGVNLDKGKNLVGCFYQPDSIIVNPLFLNTLNEKEFNCGIAEVIKYAVISDKTIFNLLQNAKENIEQIIRLSVEIKADIVESDEKESLTRMILNFGHTFGHVIEKQGNFSLYSHGEAVAYGMLLEAKLLKALGLIDDSAIDIIQNYVNIYNLNINPDLTKEYLIENIFSDKKMRGDFLYFAGFIHIGKGKIFKFTKEEMLRGLDKLFEKEGE